MLYIFIPYNRLSGRIQTSWYSVTKQEGEGWKNIVLFSATTYPNEITSFFFQVGASLGMLLKSLHSKKLYRNWMHKSQLCKAGREHIPDREDTIRRCEGTWWATYNRMIIKRRLWARCSVCTVIPELRDWHRVTAASVRPAWATWWTLSQNTTQTPDQMMEKIRDELV